MGELRTLRPRGWRPVIPAADAGTGEEPDRMPLTVADFEQVARDGWLEPGEKFPDHLEVASRPGRPCRRPSARAGAGGRRMSSLPSSSSWNCGKRIGTTGN
jgi:hypothetical protein